MYGYAPVTNKLESWWKKHGGKHDDPQWLNWIDIFDSMLQVKLKEMSEEHTNLNANGDTVFGMAGAAGCTRREGIKALRLKAEEFSGSTNFTFALGHIVEVMALATLEATGHEVSSQQETIYINDFASSAPDGVINLLNTKTVVSCKTVGYKMSGRTRKKGGGWTWRRQGFPELPFEGTYKAHTNHYLQIQAEMLAMGLSQGLMLYVSKDIIKVFENDEYLGEGGNGSLTFYTELIPSDEQLQSMIVDSMEEQWEYVQQGEAGPPRIFTYPTGDYENLHQADFDEQNIWGGPNQKITGTFNPCGGCEVREVCLSIP